MGESSPSIHQLSPVDHVLQNFTPAWFTICMDTGIIALLLHQLPYQFPGLKIISTVLFILNIILYVIFLIVFLSRLFRHPRHTMHEFGSKAGELAGLTCPVVSFLTIQAMFSVTTGQAWGHSWAVAGYVFWWIGAFLALAVLFSSFYISYSAYLRKAKAFRELDYCPKYYVTSHRCSYFCNERRTYDQLFASHGKDGGSGHHHGLSVPRDGVFPHFHHTPALCLS